MKILPLLVCICALSACFSLGEGRKKQWKPYHKKKNVQRYVFDHQFPFHPKFPPHWKLLLQKHHHFNQPIQQKPKNLKRGNSLSKYPCLLKCPVKNNTVINNNASETTIQTLSMSPTSASTKIALFPDVTPLVQNATTTSAREDYVTTHSSAGTPSPQPSSIRPETTAAPPTSSPAPPEPTAVPPTSSPVLPETTAIPPTSPQALPETTPVPHTSSRVLPETTAVPPTSPQALPETTPPTSSPASPETTATPSTSSAPQPETTAAPPTSSPAPPENTATPPTPSPVPQETTAASPTSSAAPPETIPPTSSPAPPETTAAPNITAHPSPTTLASETSKIIAAAIIQSMTPATIQTTTVEQPTLSFLQKAYIDTWQYIFNIIKQIWNVRPKQ